jgi:hypothetical protein
LLAYVDFAASESLLPQSELDNKDLKALRSAGITSRATDDGQGEFTLRVVAR